jgi:hypothetical protein
VPAVVGEDAGTADAHDGAGGGSGLVGERLCRATEGEQVELGPGEIAVVGRLTAQGPEAVGVAPVADFESRDHYQREYCENYDSGHGSNLATNQIPPQLALLTIMHKFLPY